MKKLKGTINNEKIMKMMNEIRVIEDGAVETIRRMIEGD